MSKKNEEFKKKIEMFNKQPIIGMPKNNTTNKIEKPMESKGEINNQNRQRSISNSSKGLLNELMRINNLSPKQKTVTFNEKVDRYSIHPEQTNISKVGLNDEKYTKALIEYENKSNLILQMSITDHGKLLITRISELLELCSTQLKFKLSRNDNLCKNFNECIINVTTKIIKKIDYSNNKDTIKMIIMDSINTVVPNLKELVELDFLKIFIGSMKTSLENKKEFFTNTNEYNELLTCLERKLNEDEEKNNTNFSMRNN